ncbi:hypothetical protein R5H32_02690 [Defluviimonas sp. D31]|uniref:hypothetical protein n=1 Tax=Defluviimonas sp. D31 TaxID=3083253 RepID=UPI00296FBFBF|nr:hypothetical protein [Defluviimonas sp. D31]MDW4548255.1 hypothetical protein [Defluviimonas sp. D31]
MTDTERPVADEATNATRADLEKLNGLLIRTLIQKLEDGSATTTDIGSAVKVLVSNRVQPEEAVGHQGYQGYQGYQGEYPVSDFDFPISV